MSTQKPWVSHLTPQDLFQPFPFCIYNSLLTARNPQGICLYSLSHLCMSPVPQMHWPKAWPVTMSPWNSQILSPVLRGLLINNDLTGMTRNNTFLSEFCPLVPLPGLRLREESQGLLFLLLLSRVDVFFFAMAVTSFDVEFFFPLSAPLYFSNYSWDGKRMAWIHSKMWSAPSFSQEECIINII